MRSLLHLGLKLLPLLCGLVVSLEPVNYTGFKTYEVVAVNDDQSKALHNFSVTNPDVIFFGLSKVINTSARVIVPPKDQASFESVLVQDGTKIKIILVNSDFSEVIKKEKRVSPRFDFTNVPINFNRYYTAAEINRYLNKLATLYPDRVTVKTAGYSYLKKPLKTITITNGVSANKKVIFIDAGIHAREWIAPATALQVIYQLVEKYEENKDLLQNYNFVVLPLVNPDGYEVSHSVNRLWRKTVKPNPCGNGTDANRNFNSHWAEVGTSNSGCNNKYHGDYPFSETETQTVRNILHSLAKNATMYLSLHSYGGYLLYPWGYTGERPGNWRDIHEVANAGAEAIHLATGRSYQVGSISNVLYLTSGNSGDYALEKVGIPIVITMELPFGGSGFDPYPDEIRPILDEAWHGIHAMFKRAQQKYPQ